MGSEWTTIGKVAQVFDGPHATPKKITEGPYFLSISSLIGGQLDLSKSARISEEQFEKWTRRVTPQQGDILFSYETRLGDAALMPSGIKACLGRRMGLLRPDTNKVDPSYLLFAYLGPEFQREIKTRTISGATVDRIALKELPFFPIRIPPLKEQKRISGVLRALDKKITLNQEINITLESMAQALFKSWFVDFDPVIDNALAAGNPIPEALQSRADARAALGDRRKPLPDHIRQQFPDRFVLTDEMGWVPEGWQVTPLSEAIEINPKVTIKKGQKAKHVDMKALPTSGYCVGEISEKEYAGGAKFERGDVLLARITPCLENGKTGVVDFLSFGDPGFGSTEFIVMRPKNAIGTPFVAALARQEAFRQHCISNMVGSSGRQRVQNSCFDNYFICTPKMPDILDLYRNNCEAWFEKMTALANESRSLGLLRDTLLPKLLSGELRIPEVEKQVEEAI
ncbi:restriction endonuclease subunit S [Marinobacter sp. SS13-12]|uniref:restriction endonuclease subunit S n=1 Tax=Marinobacter sp. SS13-12 TaxID=3050451 RepID=UPI00255324F7|nr:restriction endonuclease subunit S [Marinobacter sp. SS13-12]MDK8463383.1 restriction endonuclease subunit S [Marinobacter sp. SS13-12]